VTVFPLSFDIASSADLSKVDSWIFRLDDPVISIPLHPGLLYTSESWWDFFLVWWGVFLVGGSLHVVPLVVRGWFFFLFFSFLFFFFSVFLFLWLVLFPCAHAGGPLFSEKSVPVRAFPICSLLAFVRGIFCVSRSNSREDASRLFPVAPPSGRAFFQKMFKVV